MDSVVFMPPRLAFILIFGACFSCMTVLLCTLLDSHLHVCPNFKTLVQCQV